MTSNADFYKCIGCDTVFSGRENIEMHWSYSFCKPCGHDDCQCHNMEEEELEKLISSLEYSSDN